jgi:hypothetical protein
VWPMPRRSSKANSSAGVAGMGLHHDCHGFDNQMF